MTYNATWPILKQPDGGQSFTKICFKISPYIIYPILREYGRQQDILLFFDNVNCTVLYIPLDGRHYSLFRHSMRPPRACFQSVVIPIENVVRFSCGPKAHHWNSVVVLCG